MKHHVPITCIVLYLVAVGQSSKDSTSPMSETCKNRTGQVKFQDRKPDWACKIAESKLKKYWAKQTRIPFFKSKQGRYMQILLIRDTNGCHCRRRLWQIRSNFPNRPWIGKKVRACVIFFGASKICLLPALWACDLKKLLAKTGWDSSNNSLVIVSPMKHSGTYRPFCLVSVCPEVTSFCVAWEALQHIGITLSGVCPSVCLSVR